MTDPMRQIAQPSLPSTPSSSFRKYDPRTAPLKTLKAPNGVTKIAGANAYAAKLAISPATTVKTVSQTQNLKRSTYVIRCQPTILDS